MKIRSLNDLDKYDFPDAVKERIIHEYRKSSHARGKKTPGNRSSRSPAHLEPPSGNELLRANEGAAFNAPVRIDIYSRRKGKADIDNLSAKAALDGIVDSGILATDSPDQVVEYRVHKAEISDREETVIVIEEI